MSAKAPGKAPKTLLEAVTYFKDEDVAMNFVAGLHPGWENGPICPRCASDKVGFLATRRLWKCKACAKQFSVKVGTIFEDSPISLTKWLPAMWQLVNCKNGISSYELARALGVTQKTAWFMLQRLRLAVQSKTFMKLSGEVEVDETYIGGKSRNMHWDRRERAKMQQGSNTAGKVAVMGLLERHGDKGRSKVELRIVSNVKRRSLQAEVRSAIEPGSRVYTDALKSYRGLNWDFIHRVIDHAESYVNGRVHTNGCENFWSLLKRSIKGTYVAIEPFHLFRYLDEQAFRFNNRCLNDSQRFVIAMSSVFGRRLTYEGLIGHAVSPSN
jgi:transposase-like protein